MEGERDERRGEGGGEKEGGVEKKEGEGWKGGRRGEV